MTDVRPLAASKTCTDCPAIIDNHAHGNTLRCWVCQAHMRQTRARAYQAAWRARTRLQQQPEGAQIKPALSIPGVALCKVHNTW